MTAKSQGFVAAALLLPAILVVLLLLGTSLNTLGFAPILLAGFYAGIPGAVVLVAVPFLLFLPTHRVISSRHQERLQFFSLTFFAVAAGGTAWWLRIGWAYGVRYQGELAVHVFLWLDVVAFAVLALTAAANRRHPSFRTNVFFHWLLVVWLCAWAFPYFGEMP